MTDTTTTIDLPKHLRKPLLRRWEAAEYLLVVHGLEFTPATLSKWASLGERGPAFRKINNWPLYEPAELDRWAAERLGAPRRRVSDEGGGR